MAKPNYLDNLPPDVVAEISAETSRLRQEHGQYMCGEFIGNRADGGYDICTLTRGHTRRCLP